MYSSTRYSTVLQEYGVRSTVLSTLLPVLYRYVDRATTGTPSTGTSRYLVLQYSEYRLPVLGVPGTPTGTGTPEYFRLRSESIVLYEYAGSIGFSVLRTEYWSTVLGVPTSTPVRYSYR